MFIIHLMVAFFVIVIHTMAGNPGRRVQCKGTTLKGKPCKNWLTISTYAEHAPEYCPKHIDQAEDMPVINEEKETKRLNEIVEEKGLEALFAAESMTTTEKIEAQAEVEWFYVGGTGSRQLKLQDTEYRTKAFRWTVERLKRTVERHPTTVVNAAGAEGFDEMYAMAAIEVGVPLHLYLPNPGFRDWYWSADHSVLKRDRVAQFNWIAQHAEKIVFSNCPNEKLLEHWQKQFPQAEVTTLRTNKGLYLNGRHYNFIRNDDMIAASDAMFVWDPSSPGTADAYKTIKRTHTQHEIISQAFEASI